MRSAIFLAVAVNSPHSSCVGRVLTMQSISHMRYATVKEPDFMWWNNGLELRALRTRLARLFDLHAYTCPQTAKAISVNSAEKERSQDSPS
jgi:hypothetical protein